MLLLLRLLQGWTCYQGHVLTEKNELGGWATPQPCLREEHSDSIGQNLTR